MTEAQPDEYAKEAAEIRRFIDSAEATLDASYDYAADVPADRKSMSFRLASLASSLIAIARSLDRIERMGIARDGAQRACDSFVETESPAMDSAASVLVSTEDAIARLEARSPVAS